jgi:hypothetical protein
MAPKSGAYARGNPSRIEVIRNLPITCSSRESTISNARVAYSRRMGADYIGFRDCTLQRSLGDEGFLGKLKLRAYKGAVESQVPPEARGRIKIQVQTTGRAPRELDYEGICRELATFLAGSPECASCPLSGGGSPIGCYRYVTYPVDAIAEETAFGFFVRDLDVPDSIADQLYRDVVSRVPADTDWGTRRGGAEVGGLAERPPPLSFTTPKGRFVDSGRVLAAMFISLEHPALVVGYARFYRELLQYAAEQKRASRSLQELAGVADLLTNAIPYALSSGGRVFVDS